ncbi:MAG: PEP/pyruvate-binding domain-containing protein, partial [Bacteroidota bacterium]|nr:PEP/pyruvate-binding domain-containing protein [Bacteroidota bacterium]
TTSMDEIFKRRDKLIHFLRKQVHTESNNTLIQLTKKVFRFWCDGDVKKLENDVPSDVYSALDTKCDCFLPIHAMVNDICKNENLFYTDILELSVKEIEEITDKPEYSDNQRDVLRIVEIVRLYALLKEKYSFETVNIIPMLEKYTFFNQDDINAFNNALQQNNFSDSLNLIYQFMNQLKEIILNTTPSEGWENIYHKRHIAIGIPSMYGTYREIKFEALGLTFRLERIATNFMENVVSNVNLDYISKRTLQNICKILNHFIKGLELDGITSQSFNSNFSMLKYSLSSQSLSLSQYINIFQFMADDIKKIISKYFLKSYEYSLGIIIPQQFDSDNQLSNKERNHLMNEKSEIFFRDIISGAFLVQPLDNFLSRILNSLRNMIDNTKSEWINDIMTYNSDMATSSFYRNTPELDSQVFLGSKAFFLKKLYNANFPIPPGFVITTEVFRRIDTIVNHPVIKKEYDEKICSEIKQLEKIVGKKFGDYKNPLLLSVRSGTAISMPGAMDTFLNVGMNDKLTEALSKQPHFAWASWDCYRRLIQSWGMYYGISRDTFDQVIIDFKEKYNVELKVQFKPKHMREIAFAYQDILKQNSIEFEQDLTKQLQQTIRFVFKSWSSKRAQVYRDHLQIADEWGTAVVVQKMILGNLNTVSGTGVVFTQNPNRHRPGVHLYGDFSLSSQGEDVVGGLVNVYPVGKTQRKHQNIEEESLQEMLPDIYDRIYLLSKQLTENMGFNPQEIEFTFESGSADDLYILQTRDQDIKKKDSIFIFNTPSEKMKLAGRGIGIGDGVLNGIIAFDIYDLENLRKIYPDDKIILVRPDTVPDDIAMIFECDGLLTAKGGATSHAAVTAVRLGKTCVVNCSSLEVNEEKKTCVIDKIPFKSGDKIALDANTGNIFEGNYPTEKIEITTI